MIRGGGPFWRASPLTTVRTNTTEYKIRCSKGSMSLLGSNKICLACHHQIFNVGRIRADDVAGLVEDQATAQRTLFKL